jgi:DNA-binding NarL/FixJ family response regulator
VIMYTTSSQSRDIEEAMLNGAVCFITKPSSLNELKHILSSIASSLPNNLEKTLRHLSNTAGTFIVC